MYKTELNAMILEGKEQNMNTQHLLDMRKELFPCRFCGCIGVFPNNTCDRCL